MQNVSRDEKQSGFHLVAPKLGFFSSLLWPDFMFLNQIKSIPEWTNRVQDHVYIPWIVLPTVVVFVSPYTVQSHRRKWVTTWWSPKWKSWLCRVKTRHGVEFYLLKHILWLVNIAVDMLRHSLRVLEHALKSFRNTSVVAPQLHHRPFATLVRHHQQLQYEQIDLLLIACTSLHVVCPIDN